MRRTLLRFLLCMVSSLVLAELVVGGYGLIAGHDMPDVASFAIGLVIGVVGIAATTPWWMGGLR